MNCTLYGNYTHNVKSTCNKSLDSNDTMETIHKSDENPDIIESAADSIKQNPLLEHEGYLQTGKKTMVDNILYISADSATDD